MHKTIDLSALDPALAQHFLQCSVAPRPIAFASTIDAAGHVNLSPFSFFNLFSTAPPILIFSPNRRLRDGTNKHTYFNCKETNEVVINMVDFDMAEQMSLTSCEYPHGVNEFVKAGFTEVKSTKVKPPRVLEAKVSFECKINQIIELGVNGGSGNLIICEVILMHVCDSLLGENGKIDPTRTNWLARLGEDWYVKSSIENMFILPKPNVKLGVGVDAIPSPVKALNRLSGNELGRLGNITLLPTDEEVAIFLSHNQNSDLIGLAQYLLSINEVNEAWKAILGWGR